MFVEIIILLVAIVWLITSQTNIAGELRSITIKVLSVLNLLGIFYLIDRFQYSLTITLALGAFALWIIYAVFIRRNTSNEPVVNTTMSNNVHPLARQPEPAPLPPDVGQPPQPTARPVPETNPLPFDDL